jgi:hypothetical protein
VCSLASGDHVIIVNHAHLRRVLKAYLRYYYRIRTHLALAKDAPDGRTPVSVSAGRIEFIVA